MLIFTICRERYLSFVCSMDHLKDLSSETIFSILRKNLVKAQMLTYVFAFNCKSWKEELELAYGDRDMEQWKVCLATIIYCGWVGHKKKVEIRNQGCFYLLLFNLYFLLLLSNSVLLPIDCFARTL